ncbi:LLM class F420-dependent oxidoreductase [Mycobacterium sp. CBMA293]|uniref:LLM class F420-dependent oxidoreductase n=1 Tax=unclassified Mycolicibacterium TaxID=2636767 RepID=UPI0012DF4FE2|nr:MULTISPECIES: LLM class F420-dependent oxidoreductase [unclassified Mycolicibacterium]MUL47555.1 LLM class F420-dependent oxidoreductase [Mycolicibacterium sp. CBMA 360]MUL59545.1 LLM class F420-dependent oxidoreductase [Mycolicibacterium sp. CBMA 335]MUL71270.1 LLM class F420-dependent oxidoreductase [Mycolicibacterium sp. CBMA 311]MUL94913.1 LLM class F420-dependent oxidoreductase [Mycolicibacterium sp. CBMA 230]MUM03752.1 LLM class F420-dependent oxidoreductase [Mycolicibacterium sp. CBM
MRIGLQTPVVVQVPATASAWEASAGADEIGEIAAVADLLGFDYLTCSEHVVVPADTAGERGASYWDPLATLGFIAGRTTQIRLATSVLVLGYHHPLEIAKRYGTLDRISGGRLILGVGVGSLREEFDLLDAAWDDRGARADEAMTALRGALSTNYPVHQGDYYQYDGIVMEPCAVQLRVPIWVGGRTRRSLRRAVALGDGWMPFGLSSGEISAMLAYVDVPALFDIVLATPPLDPMGAPQQTVDALGALEDAGATAVTCVISSRSAAHCCEQLGALADLTNLLTTAHL